MTKVQVQGTLDEKRGVIHVHEEALAPTVVDESKKKVAQARHRDWLFTDKLKALKESRGWDRDKPSKKPFFLWRILRALFGWMLIDSGQVKIARKEVKSSMAKSDSKTKKEKPGFVLTDPKTWWVVGTPLLIAGLVLFLIAALVVFIWGGPWVSVAFVIFCGCCPGLFMILGFVGWVLRKPIMKAMKPDEDDDDDD